MNAIADAVPARILDAFHEAENPLVLTGAGMSAESGVPTFRGDSASLWAQFSPADLATPEGFEIDPELVFGWYAWRARVIADAVPNAGHVALAEWGVPVITQNVDDLHERGGSADVTHLHGELTAWRCSVCGTPWHGALDLPAEPLLRREPPECAVCGGPVRPGVVWFGEEMPQEAIEHAIEAVMAADAVLVVGTSGLVHPAAVLPDLARGHGAFVAEVNPARSELTLGVDVHWENTAATALPALVAALRG